MKKDPEKEVVFIPKAQTSPKDLYVRPKWVNESPEKRIAAKASALEKELEQKPTKEEEKQDKFVVGKLKALNELGWATTDLENAMEPLWKLREEYEAALENEGSKFGKIFEKARVTFNLNSKKQFVTYETINEVFSPEEAIEINQAREQCAQIEKFYIQILNTLALVDELGDCCRNIHDKLAEKKPLSKKEVAGLYQVRKKIAAQYNSHAYLERAKIHEDIIQTVPLRAFLEGIGERSISVTKEKFQYYKGDEWRCNPKTVIGKIKERPWGLKTEGAYSDKKISEQEFENPKFQEFINQTGFVPDNILVRASDAIDATIKFFPDKLVSRQAAVGV